MLIEFTLLTGTKSNGQIFSIKPGGCRGYLPMQRKNYLCPILTPVPGSITAAAEVLYNIPLNKGEWTSSTKKPHSYFMNGDESNEVEAGRENRVTCRIPVWNELLPIRRWFLQAQYAGAFSWHGPGRSPSSENIWRGRPGCRNPVHKCCQPE